MNTQGKPHLMDLVRQFEHVASCRTDRTFTKLMLAQWAALTVISLWLSPRTWNGTESALHPHVLFAAVGGGIIALLPLFLSRLMPGTWQTRHVIAVAQMLTSSLLIAITGGRIESHFHIFASLAFLAFYLDWTVLLTASAVAATDHVMRGIFWPESIFGAATTGHWRWLEHAGWVVLTDLFLIWSSIERRSNLHTVAQQQIEAGTLLARAHTDVLTGLPNRLSFQQWMDEHLQERRKTREPFALMYIDLDRFKEINDRLGHAAGDFVLREVACRLSAYVAPRSLLTRVGGDEFVAAFSQVPAHDEFVEIAQEITALLMLPFHYEGEQLHLGASIGISTFPEHGETAEDLVHNADQAMYRVKQQGRRGFRFCDTPDVRHGTEYDEQHLQNALDNNRFELHFQPLIDLSSNATAFEALVRWRCPERGLIPPTDFIDQAEQSGQIVQLGRFVLERAVRQAAEWRHIGLPFSHITVNVSPRQLAQRDFADHLERMLEDQEVPATAICLECTESACANNEQVQVQLQQLHARGIRIYVDDFGTGYSSLGRLQELKFDVIKIDRCFIQRLTSSETGKEIVSLMISFAHLLGMSVVAEGVETTEQFEALQALGCDHIQGYYIAKPMEAEHATAYLQSRYETATAESRNSLDDKLQPDKQATASPASATFLICDPMTA